MAKSPEKPTGTNDQGQGNPEGRSELKGFLSKEMTPIQRSWLIRILVGLAIAFPAGYSIFRAQKRAGMMKIIETYGGVENPQFNGNYISGKHDENLLNTLEALGCPADKLKAEPIEFEACGRKLIAHPCCADYFMAANQKMEQDFEEAKSHPVRHWIRNLNLKDGRRCIKVAGARSGVTNEEQTEIYRESLKFPEQPGDVSAPKLTPEDLKKITDPETGELIDEEQWPGEILKKLEHKYRAAPTSLSFHETYCAFDIENWKQAGPYLRDQHFQGGGKFFGLIKEMPDDAGHFSIGEFKILNPAQIQNKAKRNSKGGMRGK
jgi:hypothetical protein